MKTINLCAITGFLLTTLTGRPANAQDPSFILANNTAFIVHSVYIWPAESEFLGPDRLGNAIIRSGGSYMFVPRDGDCMYNIRVTLEHTNRVAEFNDVDLCETSRLTLNYDYQERTLWASTQ